MKIIYVDWEAWAASSVQARKLCGARCYVDHVARATFVASLKRRRDRMCKAATLSPAVDAWCRRHGRGRR